MTGLGDEVTRLPLKHGDARLIVLKDSGLASCAGGSRVLRGHHGTEGAQRGAHRPLEDGGYEAITEANEVAVVAVAVRGQG